MAKLVNAADLKSVAQASRFESGCEHRLINSTEGDYDDLYKATDIQTHLPEGAVIEYYSPSKQTNYHWLCFDLQGRKILMNMAPGESAITQVRTCPRKAESDPSQTKQAVPMD